MADQKSLQYPFSEDQVPQQKRIGTELPLYLNMPEPELQPSPVALEEEKIQFPLFILPSGCRGIEQLGWWNSILERQYRVHSARAGYYSWFPSIFANIEPGPLRIERFAT